IGEVAGGVDTPDLLLADVARRGPGAALRQPILPQRVGHRCDPLRTLPMLATGPGAKGKLIEGHAHRPKAPGYLTPGSTGDSSHNRPRLSTENLLRRDLQV